MSKYGLLLTGLLLINFTELAAANSDSLAYIFRQDNLSTNNDLQLNYKIKLPNSTLLINDVIRYKVFAFEHQENQGNQYSIDHQLQSEWGWGAKWLKSIRLESSQYEDHRTGLASTINNLALLGGVKRDDGFSLFTGARSIERYGISDQGWTTELELEQAWQSGSQRSNIQLSGNRDELDEHLNHMLNAQANYLIRFGSISDFKTSVQRSARLQAFFTDSLGSSQSRYNENLQWQNLFTYSLSENVKFSHRLDWGEQLTTIDQEKVALNVSNHIAGEDRKRLALTNESGIEITGHQFSSLTSFKVENSQNKYYVDYTQVMYNLNEILKWNAPGLVDSLAWATQLSRLEYDTPDTTNDDDRDEWRLNTQLRLVWQPSPYYSLELGTKLSFFHLLYLMNTRSAENHWNRNLVLWSGLSWSHQAWEGEGRARIRSNYFDYDYDALFTEMEQPTRSFVHRSLDLQQQLSYRFNQRWSVTSKVAARWEDEGQLNWDAFVQQVTSDREQIEVIVKLFYDYRGWKGWVGYLTHDRITKYSATNRDAESWTGEGPLIGVQHRLASHLFLDADARFISVHDQQRDYLLPKVYLSLVYR